MDARYAVLLLLNIICRVIGRARLVEPPMRSSIWRHDFQAPVNYMDELLNCGGFQKQWRFANGKCGACGDPYLDESKPNEYPGVYSRQKPVRTLLQGGFLNITVYTKPNMLGYFQFRLCPEQDSPKLTDLQSCFDKYPLTVLETNYTQYYPGSKGGFYDMHVVLPKLVSCERCVIQWKYVTGYRLGWNPNSCGQCLGCGAQETYINCADISIVNSLAALENSDDDDVLHQQHHHDNTTPSHRNALTFPNNSHAFHTHPNGVVTSSVLVTSSITTSLQTSTTSTSTTTRTTATAKPSAKPTSRVKPVATSTTVKPTTTIKTTMLAPATTAAKLASTTMTVKPAMTITAPGTSKSFPRRPACSSFYPNITCGARGLQKFVPGMKSWCSYQCSAGTCPYVYCECFCLYPDGTSVYLHDPPRAITPIHKLGHVSETCYGPVEVFKDNPGMPLWCQLNCPGISCFNICEPVDCQK